MSNFSANGSTGFGAQSFPIFGGQNPTQAGLFAPGAPFEQRLCPQSFFGVRPETNPSNILNQPQQPLSSNLFGSNSGASFPQKPGFVTFSSSPSTGIFSSSLFTSPQAPTTTLFGQTCPPFAGPFSGTTAFETTSNPQTGTVHKFNPVNGTDSITQQGRMQSFKTRHQCITFMKEYTSKSFEELRYEDYIENRKGLQQSKSGGAGLFGQMSATPAVSTASGLFGFTQSMPEGSRNLSSVYGVPQYTNSFEQNNNFGGPLVTSTAASFSCYPQPISTVALFGNTQPACGTTATHAKLYSLPQTTNTFGAINSFGKFEAPTSTNNGFALKKNNTGNLNLLNSAVFNTFGQHIKPTGNIFGMNVGFGPPSSSQSTVGGFGIPSTSQPTVGGFGIPTTSQPTFGGFGTLTASQPNFCGFGTLTTSQPIFGGFGTLTTSQPTCSGFGTLTTSPPTCSGFGQTQSQTNSWFNNSTFTKPATGRFEPIHPQNNIFGGVNLNLSQSQAKVNETEAKTPNNMFRQSESQQKSISLCGFGQQITGLTFEAPGQDTQQSSLLALSSINRMRSSVIHDQILTISKPFYTIGCLKDLSRFSNKKITNNNPITLHPIVQGNIKFSTNLSQIPIKKRTVLSKTEMKLLFDELEADDQSMHENLFVTKLKNPRRLHLEKNHSENDYINQNTLAEISTTQTEYEIINSEISTKQDLEKSWMGDLKLSYDKNGLDDVDIKTLSTKHTQTDGPKVIPTVENSVDNDMNLSHPTRIICTKPGYYTIPSLDELAETITPDGRCMVQGFTIGRHGIGNVFFPDLFDVSGINIDKNVHFRIKELEIYVDEQNKPPLGEELNRPAEITLLQVYPRNRDTLQLITDVDQLVQMNFEDTLRTTCQRQRTDFVDYQPETGSWVFHVEHFTIYGIYNNDIL